MDNINTYTVKTLDIGFINEINCIEKTSFSNPWSTESYLPEIKNGNVIGCVLNSKLIGFAVFHKNIDETELLKIATKVEYGRKGVATKLLTDIETESVKNSIFSIFLEVSKINISAIKFYEKNGYFKIGLRKRYYPDLSDAIVMKKKL